MTHDLRTSNNTSAMGISLTDEHTGISLTDVHAGASLTDEQTGISLTDEHTGFSRVLLMMAVWCLLLCAVLSFPDNAFAEDVWTVSYEQDGVTLTGTTDGESVKITGCSSDQRFYEVNIPGKIDGIPVCSIDPGAFQYNALITSVTIPDGVKSLEPMSFYKCTALNSIDLNNVETLGDIISGWMTLGETWSLETITVSEDNPGLTVSDGVLFNKDMTELMVYPVMRPGKTYVIPGSVTSLWNRAFNRTIELEEVTLSDGIKSYADSFFLCPALKTINLNMLEKVNGSNFYGCTALENITISENNDNFMIVDGVLFSRDLKKILFYPPGRKGDSYTIQGGVTEIADSAFEFSCLKQIIMPDSLTLVSHDAFYGSERLEELIFPEGLKKIDSNACTGCESLKAVFVPDSVTAIEYGSLDGSIYENPYAVVYGNTKDASGEYTCAYRYVSEHSDEYVFKDIAEEKMPRTLELGCADELTLDAGVTGYDLGAVCLAELVYESSAPEVVSVDSEGKLTTLKNGTAIITVTAPADLYHDEVSRTVPVTVIGGSEQEEDIAMPPASQKIKGSSSFKKTFGCKAFSLKQTAKTTLAYKSSNKKIATVSNSGKVKILRPGKVRIYVTAAGTSKYLKAKKTITVKASLKVPSLKAEKNGRKVKLSWSKVPKASGYQLYIRFPGKKKYEKVRTESAKVKSITHRGLSKGKTYRYKLRAFTKVGEKKYYSGFSKVKTVKIK